MREFIGFGVNSLADKTVLESRNGEPQGVALNRKDVSFFLLPLYRVA